MELNHKKRTFLSVAVKWFWVSLFMTAICIILNIICTILLAQGSVIPYALHWFLNTLYFIFIVVLSSMLAMYVFHRLLEYISNNYCIKRAKVMLLILTLGYICVVIANLKLGIIFWFDASGSYHRGPLNSLGYGVAIIEMALMYQCYFKHKASVSKEMTKVMLSMTRNCDAISQIKIENYPDIELSVNIGAIYCQIPSYKSLIKQIDKLLYKAKQEKESICYEVLDDIKY